MAPGCLTAQHLCPVLCPAPACVTPWRNATLCVTCSDFLEIELCALQLITWSCPATRNTQLLGESKLQEPHSRQPKICAALSPNRCLACIFVGKGAVPAGIPVMVIPLIFVQTNNRKGSDCESFHHICRSAGDICPGALALDVISTD